MTASRHHRSPDGVWRPCGANLAACPYGQADHLTAEEWSERQQHKPGYRHHENAPMPAFDFVRGPNNNSRTSKALRIAPTGFTGKYCEWCDHYLTRGVLDGVDEFDIVQCPACDECIEVNDQPVDIREGEMKYINDSVVRDSHWFHITTHANWIEGTQSAGVMTHLGSRESAMDRLNHLVFRDAEKTATQEEQHYYLYEVALKPKVGITPGIMRDQVTSWPKKIADIKELRFKDFFKKGHVTRYMNIYEGPGTVSLLADPTSYTLVARETIPLR